MREHVPILAAARASSTAWIWARAGTIQSHAQALQRVTSEHVTSSEVANQTLMLAYGAPPWTAADGTEALRKILTGNKDMGVQQACLAELALLVGTNESCGEAGRAEAEALLVRIEKETPTWTSTP